MSKKRFIQSVIARSLPKHENLDAAIAYAEKLWDEMTRRGYGDDKKEPEARLSEDWLERLSERQRRWFSGFWQAFAYKKGVNRAARRWYLMGEMSDDAYRQIIEAAKKEADAPLPPGQVRKMAEGWLSERRYLDHLPQAKGKNSKNHVLVHLNNELAAVKRLYQTSGDNALAEQIKNLEEAIKCAGQNLPVT